MHINHTHKILYINSTKNDFLADSFLIGLKELFGENVYEYPENKFIYKTESKNTNAMHGIGFTLYHLIDSAKCKTAETNFHSNQFDLIIFGDIYRQSDLYLKWYRLLDPKKTIILDGEDTPALWPYYFAPWKKPYSIFYPKLHKRFIYFKREIIPYRTNYYRFYKLIPKFISGKIALPSKLQTISFSIPNEKIAVHPCSKNKLFGKHIVDEEVHRHVEGSRMKYAFEKEDDYYRDLQESKFGITTKRGGWDCLRHYEIAANGAVICFKNLSHKPKLCAPHGLEPGINCIEYSDYNDLMKKINLISEEEYQKLRDHSLKWVNEYSCKNLVKKTIDHFFSIC